MTADEIRQLRLGLNMSQEEFARELGISFATVNRWENNKSAPSHLAQRLLDQVRKRQNRFQASS
ncbi:MAG TPA: helix-turn-helix domain-containing protein [Planctomycetota bacterium]|nr:helix-turn-helix domain-containing protein [Planctomycetota bacterium]